MEDLEWEKFDRVYKERAPDLQLFMNGVAEFFSAHPTVKKDGKAVIHSLKKRLKDSNHLREKILRKNSDFGRVTVENFLNEITDLAGVRLLLLFQGDIATIDSAIRQKVAAGDWTLKERAKAFTWDPEASLFFQTFNVDVEQRDTYYTSVHYLVKPREDSNVCCEVQVRTLFEEIWGEVDHMINYPKKTESVACAEQLMVLSKIVGAGSRLVDSIRRTLDIESEK